MTTSDTLVTTGNPFATTAMGCGIPQQGFDGGVDRSRERSISLGLSDMPELPDFCTDIIPDTEFLMPFADIGIIESIAGGHDLNNNGCPDEARDILTRQRNESMCSETDLLFDVLMEEMLPEAEIATSDWDESEPTFSLDAVTTITAAVSNKTSSVSDTESNNSLLLPAQRRSNRQRVPSRRYLDGTYAVQHSTSVPNDATFSGEDNYIRGGKGTKGIRMRLSSGTTTDNGGDTSSGSDESSSDSEMSTADSDAIVDVESLEDSVPTLLLDEQQQCARTKPLSPGTVKRKRQCNNNVILERLKLMRECKRDITDEGGFGVNEKIANTSSSSCKKQRHSSSGLSKKAGKQRKSSITLLPIKKEKDVVKETLCVKKESKPSELTPALVEKLRASKRQRTSILLAKAPPPSPVKLSSRALRCIDDNARSRDAANTASLQTNGNKDSPVLHSSAFDHDYCTAPVSSQSSTTTTSRGYPITTLPSNCNAWNSVYPPRRRKVSEVEFSTSRFAEPENAILGSGSCVTISPSKDNHVVVPMDLDSDEESNKTSGKIEVLPDLSFANVAQQKESEVGLNDKEELEWLPRRTPYTAMTSLVTPSNRVHYVGGAAKQATKVVSLVGNTARVVSVTPMAHSTEVADPRTLNPPFPIVGTDGKSYRIPRRGRPPGPMRQYTSGRTCIPPTVTLGSPSIQSATSPRMGSVPPKVIAALPVLTNEHHDSVKRATSISPDSDASLSHQKHEEMSCKSNGVSASETESNVCSETKQDMRRDNDVNTSSDAASESESESERQGRRSWRESRSILRSKSSDRRRRNSTSGESRSDGHHRRQSSTSSSSCDDDDYEGRRRRTATTRRPRVSSAGSASSATTSSSITNGSSSVGSRHHRWRHNRSGERSRHRSRSRSSASQHRRRRDVSPVSKSNDDSNGKLSDDSGRNQQFQMSSEERKVIYVGELPTGYSREQLRERFIRFGPIRDIRLYFRKNGENFGFVTFETCADAYRAVERGNEYGEPKFKICFGGRRQFCRRQWLDLDSMPSVYVAYDDSNSNGALSGVSGIEPDPTPCAAASSVDNDDFDALLRAVQRKARQQPKERQT